MPRQARLDAPGLLHHVMARGLNRQTIFRDMRDYDDFSRRIPLALERSPNEILAWALMPNHVHFLIRSGRRGVSGFMRRLLTGYALSFNRRHKRVGYLFQGRYKSLVCEQEEYFLTLVRYIHLNPVVGGIVKSVRSLRKHPYSGHAAMMGDARLRWQSIDEVLGRFGHQAGRARQRYEEFLEEGLPEVRRLPLDLVGGGLLKELEDMSIAFRRDSDRALRDRRILGDSEFVKQVWDEVEKQEDVQRALKRKGIGLRGLARRVAEAYAVTEKSLFSRDRSKPVSAAKASFIHAAAEYLGRTLKEMARLTRMSEPAASKAKRRGASSSRIDFPRLFGDAS
jgi:REP element-mobilizing transposase RayT